jgi:hypothetical protein
VEKADADEPTSRRAWIVLLVLGFVLLAASVLKAQALLGAQGGTQGERIGRWILVGCESALGGWLVLGLCLAPTWCLALACFSAFLATNLVQGLAGEVSCGCFGNLALSPWRTASLDGTAIVLLLLFNPYSRLQYRKIGWRITATALGVPFVLAVGMALIGMRPFHAFSRLSAAEPKVELLRPSIPSIDFGTMPQSERREIIFWLTNPSPESVEIADIESSCDCFQVDLERRTVVAGAKIKAVARLELDKEPHFTGELQPEVRATTPSGNIAFLLRASVRVVRK